MRFHCTLAGFHPWMALRSVAIKTAADDPAPIRFASVGRWYWPSEQIDLPEIEFGRWVKLTSALIDVVSKAGGWLFLREHRVVIGLDFAERRVVDQDPSVVWDEQHGQDVRLHFQKALERVPGNTIRVTSEAWAEGHRYRIDVDGGAKIRWDLTDRGMEVEIRCKEPKLLAGLIERILRYVTSRYGLDDVY